MSLHAPLSPEALEKLRIQRRNSSISSMMIAVLTIVLIGLILGIILLPKILNETPTIVTYESALKEETDLSEQKVSTSMDRRPSSPSSSMAKVIAANTTSAMAVPVPDVDVTTPSLDFGDGNDLGTGWGEGGDGGGGGGFGGVPATMKKRCSKADRLSRLRETGGTPECEDAVVKGLNWLKATQSSDGSWPGGNTSAVTGLALLAYLGHCETPLSKDYGESVLRAITYLVDLGMKQNGKVSSSPDGQPACYEHAIATYALAEASTFCKQGNIKVPYLFEVTQKAGQYIINNQHANGGWAYGYATSAGHTDLSITAWQMQALKACHHTGLEFKDLSSATRKATKYITSLSCNNGGFAYNAPNQPKPYYTLTGAGMLSLQMWNVGSTSVRAGGKYIEKYSKFDYRGESGNLYTHYYEAQAMMNRGGSDWKKYNEMFRPELLKNQNSDGSWPVPGFNHAAYKYGNATYRTCLCILMLEVYYRFLPGTGKI